MKADGFADNVLAVMASEHGCSGDEFEYLRPRLVEIFPVEGKITDEELFDLCCGACAEEEPRTAELEARYPLLTRVFESVFE